jgi:hypothetical protein
MMAMLTDCLCCIWLILAGWLIMIANLAGWLCWLMDGLPGWLAVLVGWKYWLGGRLPIMFG